MQNESDLVESLLRRAGPRAEPPEDAYRQVHAAATAAFRDKTTRRRERPWVLWAGAAAVAVFAIALMFEWTPPSAGRSELARVERVIGGAEEATGDTWRALGETRTPLTARHEAAHARGRARRARARRRRIAAARRPKRK